MERQVLALFVFIVIVCSGCVSNVTPPSDDAVPVFSDPAAEESGSVDSDRTLPSSYSPIDRNDVNKVALRRIQDAFRNVARGTAQLSASRLQAITSGRGLSIVSISGCDLEVLKALVASDWVPVVVIRSPVGPEHIRALVGYDDSAERLILIDPINFAEARLEYSDFSKQWVDPQNACLLVFPQRVVIEGTVERALANYLPEEKVKSVSVRIPKRR